MQNFQTVNKSSIIKNLSIIVCPRLNVTLFVLCLSFFLLPSQTFGNEENKAETLESHGLALYQQELYDEAVRAFRQLLEIRPSQQVYFNIGQCEFMRKRFDLALEAFTVYLAGDQEKIAEKRREYTEKVIEEITPLVGRLQIQGDSRLEVWIDDELRGRTPVEKPLYALEGEHRLTFKKNDEVVHTETYAIRTGEMITVQAPVVASEPAPAPEAEAETEAVSPVEETAPSASIAPSENVADLQPEPAKSALPNIGIVTASLGGAGLVAGIVTGSLALSKDNQLSDRCPDKDQSCPTSNKTLANRAMALGTSSSVLLPIGAAMVVTGVTLAIVGHRKGSEARQSEKVGLWRVAPYGSRNQGGFLIEGRF